MEEQNIINVEVATEETVEKKGFLTTAKEFGKNNWKKIVGGVAAVGAIGFTVIMVLANVGKDDEVIDTECTELPVEDDSTDEEAI